LVVSGSKIKALRAKTNTYIKTPVRGEEPVFVVTGRREDVAAAKREILSASEHFSQIRASRLGARAASPGVAVGGMGGRPAGGTGQDTGGQVTIHVRVPYRVVGLVVGPKGATIKRIQQDSSTYIVTPSRDREPVFEVTGTCDGVEKARRDIESYIALRTGVVPDSVAPAPSVVPGPSGADQRDVDARIVLSSLLKSAPAGSSVLQNGCGGLSSSAAALLSYNNAVNLGGLAASPTNDILAGGFAVGGAGAVKPPTQQYAAATACCDNASKSFPAALFDYDCTALCGTELLSHNNNNGSVVAPSTDGWSASNGVDLTPLGLRSLAALLSLDDYAGMKYPSGMEMPSSLDFLVTNYPTAGPSLLDGRPADGGGGLCGFVGGGGSDSSRSGSGSSPPSGSPAESVTSPRRLQPAAAPPGCMC